MSEANRLDSLVVLGEVVSETWRTANPRHCPVVLRDGDGKSVGACWHYLRDGVCPSHGQIYQPNSPICVREAKRELERGGK